MSVRSTLRRHPVTAVPAIALAGLALVGAGCGNSDGNGGGGGAKKQAPSGGGGGGGGVATITESGTDFKFSQPNPTAKSGKVTVRFTNDGQAPHAIEIEKTPKGDVGSKTIQPGESTTLSVDLKPGKYEFYCPVANHKALGMTGELTVE